MPQEANNPLIQCRFGIEDGLQVLEDAASAIRDAVASGAPPPVVARQVQRFKDFARIHMQITGEAINHSRFPESAGHRATYAELTRQLDALWPCLTSGQECQGQCASCQTAAEQGIATEHWLRDKLSALDRAFCDWLKNWHRGVAGA